MEEVVVQRSWIVGKVAKRMQEVVHDDQLAKAFLYQRRDDAMMNDIC